MTKETRGTVNGDVGGTVPRLAILGEDWQRALAVVAHPDDLEYGAASAVARWTAQGKSVGYLLVTHGEAGIDGMEPAQAGRIREFEQREAAALVGVTEVELLDYPDGRLEYGLDLRRDIAAAIRRSLPEVVVSLNYRLESFGGINMADHRAVGLAVLDGIRDAANRWAFPELTRAGLEPWRGVRMACFAASPSPTHAVDVTEHLEAGIASLRCHRRYLAGLGSEVNPEGFLRDQAGRSGAQAGSAAAVTFEVVFS